MTHAAKLAREDALTEAIQVADRVIGDEAATPQALRIITAIRTLRDANPARIKSLTPIDYLSRVQEAARAQWLATKRDEPPEPEASAGIDTPIGRLRAVVWQRPWQGKRGDRIAWAAEYYLDDEPITIAEIRDAGLAQRPTTRSTRKRLTTV